jgi:hypothetical protein
MKCKIVKWHKKCEKLKNVSNLQQGNLRRNQVSISSTYYACNFRTNFWRQVTFQLGTKNLYENCARKMLMKLTAEDLKDYESG